MFQYNFTKTQGRLDVALELEFADPWCRTVSIQNPLFFLPFHMVVVYYFFPLYKRQFTMHTSLHLAFCIYCILEIIPY